MFRGWRRRRRLAQVQPGDGRALQRYRFYHPFTRSLFFEDIVDDQGRHTEYAVDVRHHADSLKDIDSDDGGGGAHPQVALYRDRVQIHRANAPATLPVPGGVIEVARSAYGLKRMHHRDADGTERALRPHRSSAEGLRLRFGMRFPRLSRLLGASAVLVLMVGLVLLVPQTLDLLSRIEPVQERFGTFTSPVQLPGWLNISLVVGSILAATERALTLRNHWLLDLDTTWTAFT